MRASSFALLRNQSFGVSVSNQKASTSSGVVDVMCLLRCAGMNGRIMSNADNMLRYADKEPLIKPHAARVCAPKGPSPRRPAQVRSRDYGNAGVGPYGPIPFGPGL